MNSSDDSNFFGNEITTILHGSACQHPPHVSIMAALAPHMDKTEFAHWTVKGSQLPLKWADALPRVAERHFGSDA